MRDIPLAVEDVCRRLEVHRHFAIAEIKAGWVGEDGVAPFVEEWGAADVARDFAWDMVLRLGT